MTEENGKSEPRYCAYMLAIIGFLRNYTQNTLILHLVILYPLAHCLFSLKLPQKQESKKEPEILVGTIDLFIVIILFFFY